jgi:hypothetical protein
LYSVDEYYNNLCTAQITELKQTNRFRFLNYLPSPGYSPFTGGFSLSFNVLGPLQEFRNKNLTTQKILSIQEINQLQCSSLKNEIKADYQLLTMSIDQYYSRDTLDQLTLKAYDLSKKQYQRNEITPSDFIAIQKNYESYKISRTAEANTIRKEILQLLIKSKMPIN